MKKPLKIALWIGGSVAGLIAIGFFGLIAVGYIMFGSFGPSNDDGSSTISWRSSLPETAADVHEHAWADGFLPDYDYYLRARVTKPEFDKFVQDLGLTPHTTTRIYSESSCLSWSGHLPADSEWSGRHLRQRGRDDVDVCEV
jgi:hypothetical protein